MYSTEPDDAGVSVLVYFNITTFGVTFTAFYSATFFLAFFFLNWLKKSKPANAGAVSFYFQIMELHP
jgi:hypothetical protein